jgi:VanZ family protein
VILRLPPYFISVERRRPLLIDCEKPAVLERLARFPFWTLKRRGTAMTSKSRLRLIRLCGVLALVAVILATLMLPTKWEQLRTGHWALEHFLGYFAAASIVCLGWPRPMVVAGFFLPFAALLEGLQAFTPDHTPAALSAVSGAGGALAAALLAKIVIQVRNQRTFTERQVQA